MDNVYRVFQKGQDPRTGEIVTGLPLKAIITQPLAGETLPAGAVVVLGAAYAGETSCGSGGGLRRRGRDLEAGRSSSARTRLSPGGSGSSCGKRGPRASSRSWPAPWMRDGRRQPMQAELERPRLRQQRRPEARRDGPDRVEDSPQPVAPLACPFSSGGTGARFDSRRITAETPFLNQARIGRQKPFKFQMRENGSPTLSTMRSSCAGSIGISAAEYIGSQGITMTAPWDLANGNSRGRIASPHEPAPRFLHQALDSRKGQQLLQGRKRRGAERQAAGHVLLQRLLRGGPDGSGRFAAVGADVLACGHDRSEIAGVEALGHADRGDPVRPGGNGRKP